MTGIAAPHPPASRLALRVFPYLAMVVVVAGWLSLQVENGYFDPFMFGTDFHPHALPEVRALVPENPSYKTGYDGQFYVQMAVRPSPADPALHAALDNAPYRLRRIGWPALVHVVGFGHAPTIIHLYLWSNLVCWILLAARLWQRFMRVPSWTTAAGWFLAVTGMGMLSSLRWTLLDVPALALLVLALDARESGRLGLCALLVAGAAMVKETSLLGIVLLVPDNPRHVRACLRSAALAALAAAPVLAWTSWLGMRFGWAPLGGHENLAWPGVAGVARLGEILADCLARDFARPTLGVLFTGIGLVFQLVCLARWVRPTTPAGRLGIAYAVLFLCAGANVWEGSIMALPRVVLPFSVIAILSATDRKASWGWIVAHALVAAQAWDIFKLPVLRHIL